MGMMIMLVIILVSTVAVVLLKPSVADRIRVLISGTEAGYELAEYDKYNSPAEENGRDGDYIYIIAENIEKIDNGLLIKTSEGNWLIPTASFDEDITNDIIKSDNVKIYGSYMGYSEVYKCPAMLGERYVADGKVYVSTISNLMSASQQ